MIKLIGMVILCIVFVRFFLFSDTSITLYSLTNEITPTMNQERLAIYVQKSSFRGLRSFLDHGYGNRELMFHKVAKLDFYINDLKLPPKITTVVENDSEDSYRRFDYRRIPNFLIDEFCSQSKDDNGYSDCSWGVSQTLDNKRVINIYNKGYVDSGSIVLTELGSKEEVLCKFNMMDFRDKVSVLSSVEALDFQDITFNLLKSNTVSFYTILKSQVDRAKYYRVSISGCLEAIDIEEINLESKLGNDVELGNISMLDIGLFLATNTKERSSLVLIDLTNNIVQPIIRKRINYVFDKKSRKLVFYDMNDITMPLKDKLNVEIFSIDSARWEKFTYEIEFPYDRYIYNVREFLPTIF